MSVRETVNGGTYYSYRAKTLREDRVFGHDALACDDAFVFQFIFGGVSGTGNHDPVFT